MFHDLDISEEQASYYLKNVSWEWSDALWVGVRADIPAGDLAVMLPSQSVVCGSQLSLARDFAVDWDSGGLTKQEECWQVGHQPTGISMALLWDAMDL